LRVIYRTANENHNQKDEDWTVIDGVILMIIKKPLHCRT